MYVYSNIDPVPSPTKSTSPVFDEARMKTWVQGNCFITVRTGRVGWAEIIMRRPSGCVCWIQQFNFKNPLLLDVYVFQVPRTMYSYLEIGLIQKGD